MREGDQRFFSISFFSVDVCRCIAEVVKRVYIRLMGYDWRPEKGVGFGLTLDRRIPPFLTHQIKPSRKYSARYRFYVPKCCILALEFHLDFLGLTWNGAKKPSNTVFSPLPPPGVGPGWRGLVGRLFSSFYGWSDRTVNSLDLTLIAIAAFVSCVKLGFCWDPCIHKPWHEWFRRVQGLTFGEIHG